MSEYPWGPQPKVTPEKAKEHARWIRRAIEAEAEAADLRAQVQVLREALERPTPEQIDAVARAVYDRVNTQSTLSFDIAYPDEQEQFRDVARIAVTTYLAALAATPTPAEPQIDTDELETVKSGTVCVVTERRKPGAAGISTPGDHLYGVFTDEATARRQYGLIEGDYIPTFDTVPLWADPHPTPAEPKEDER